MDGSRAGCVMPNEFEVVGESRTDSQCLLVQGSDGRYYSYHPRRRRLVPVEVDERWQRYSDEGTNDNAREEPLRRPRPARGRPRDPNDT